MVNFFTTHDASLVTGVFFFFFVLVLIARFWGNRFPFINYRCLTALALAFLVTHTTILIAVQYYVWSQGSVVTQALVNLPLPPQTPLLFFLEPFRSLVFNGEYGYFAFYSLTRLLAPAFAGTLLGSVVAGIIFTVMQMRNIRISLKDVAPVVLFSSLMGFGFVGFIKVVVFIIGGFVFALLVAIMSKVRGIQMFTLEEVWIVAAPIAFLFGVFIFQNIFYLYTYVVS